MSFLAMVQSCRGLVGQPATAKPVGFDISLGDHGFHTHISDAQRFQGPLQVEYHPMRKPLR